MPKPIIQVKDLNVIYFKDKPNQVNALLGANLEIYQGEFIIFFGPSGCGKSTLLYSIAGLERNIEGNIFINDKDLSKITGTELDFHRQKTIGMIFQAFYLINSLPVFKNIILPQFSLDTKVKDREKKAMELMQFFGINKQKDKYPNELSGGQQQRVAICRALITDPQMILADEPTGNLDSKSAIDVMNTLLDLNQEQGKTIILVTHSPGSLEYAHRVFYMKDGKIIDEKVNRKLGEKIVREKLGADVLAADLETAEHPASGTALLRAQKAKILSDWQTKNIVCEALTGYSLEEFHDLENALTIAISDTKKKFKYTLCEYLDKDVYDGGFGLNTKTAQHLSGKMERLVNEVKHFNKILGDKDQKNASDSVVDNITNYLISYFSCKFDGVAQKSLFRSLVEKRIKGDTNFEQLRKNLDLPVEEGGLGMDKRLANKVSKHLEYVILSNKKI